MAARLAGAVVNEAPVAFVQVNLGFHEARQIGDLSGRAYCLGFYLACEANFMTKRVTTKVAQIADDLEWDCSHETVRRALTELRDQGFVEYDVRPGERRGYGITVTPKLVYDKSTSTRPPHDLQVKPVTSVEVTSTSTSTSRPDEIPSVGDDEAHSEGVPPPHEPPHETGGQERSRYRKKEPRPVKEEDEGRLDWARFTASRFGIEVPEKVGPDEIPGGSG